MSLPYARGWSVMVVLRRGGATWLIRGVVAAGVVALFLWRVDVREGFRELTEVDLRWVIPGLLMFTLSKSIHAFRWRAFLWHRDLPMGSLLGIFLVSNLGNALIPFRAGDLLRIEVPARRYNVPRAELASSVLVVESVLDGVAFVALIAAAAPFLDVPPAVRVPFIVFSVGALLLLGGLLVLIRVAGRFDYANVWPVRWLAPRPRASVARMVPQFLDGMASLGSAKSLSLVVALSCLSWIAEIGVYWMMGEAFGLSLSLAEATVVMIAANMIVSIPITPWAVGPYEVVVTETLVLLDATRAVASGYALGSHILLQVWIGITGVIAMLLLDLRPRDLLPQRPPPSAPVAPAAPATGPPAPTAPED